MCLCLPDWLGPPQSLLLNSVWFEVVRDEELTSQKFIHEHNDEQANIKGNMNKKEDLKDMYERLSNGKVCGRMKKKHEECVEEKLKVKKEVV